MRGGTRVKHWLSFRAALAGSLTVAFMALAAPAHAEKRVALVIGNNVRGFSLREARCALRLTHHRKPAIDGNRGTGDEVRRV
jgi:hypothetical protein